MQLFDKQYALHFVSGSPLPQQSAIQSLQAFHHSQTKTSIAEPSTDFDVHRGSLLTASERWLLYGLTHYRRAFDMLIPAAAPWCHVTLYYASFFSANAILGMFGGWVGHLKSGPCIVEVDSDVPGAQSFKVHRGKGLKSPNAARGSHQMFWDWFYDSVGTISPFVVDKELKSVLQPVNGDTAWQTSARNVVNYDTFGAWSASMSFHSSFKSTKPRESVKGALAQQLETTELMLRLALTLAGELGLDAGALRGCSDVDSGARAVVQRSLVRRKPPAAINQSELDKMLL